MNRTTRRRQSRQNGWRVGRGTGWLAAAALAVGMLASSQAGNRWFTARTVGDLTVPLGSWAAGSPPARSGVGLLGDASVAAGGLIDLVICLEGVPAGDNDGNSQGTPGSQQDVYERIIQHFANAVYESTEGQHKLRNVRIYTGGMNADKADIVWAARGHSFTPCRGSVGEAGAHVTMFDVFMNGQYLGMDNNNVAQYADYDYLADERGAGYVLGHEWGHYFYGLYDEFPLDSGDVPVVPSLMNSPWQAATGDTRWLNFSVKNSGGGDYQNTLKTEQHRKLRSSAWETLTRDPSADILGLGGRTCRLGARTYYPELAAAAPVADAVPALNLPGSARSDLNIIWMLDSLLIEIVIDRSGSMYSDNKMENAKTAAKLLVDQLGIGNTIAGVYDFDDRVTELVALTPISSQAVKDDIKSKIDGLYDRGMTALYAAGQRALDSINNYVVTNVAKVVFLLTDGWNNESPSTPDSLIANAQASQVPIFTFAYGDDADEDSLQRIARETGGSYYFSPTTLAAIAQALSDAYSGTSTSVGIQADTLTVGMNVHKIQFEIDSTLHSFSLVFIHEGSQSDATVTLADPGGTQVPHTTVYSSGSDTIYTFQVDPAMAGTWVISAQANTDALAASYQVQGLPAGLPYWASLSSDNGDVISSPTPLLLTARLQKDGPITGAGVRGTAIQPNGVSVPVQFVDEGNGTYTANFPYSQTGAYDFIVNFDNDEGAAAFTYQGAHLTPRRGNDTNPLSVPGSVVGVDFRRSARCRVTVEGSCVAFSITPEPVQTDTVLVRQTGLYYQPVAITNTGMCAIDGFRLLVGSLPAQAQLYNAAGVANNTPYVEYAGVIAPGSGVRFGLEYFVPRRDVVPNPVFAGQVLAVPPPTPPNGTRVQILRVAMLKQSPFDGAFLVEFETLAQWKYHIQYSADLAGPWKSAVPPVEGTGHRAVWMDTGPPKTDARPGPQTQRYYRIVAEP